MSALVQVANPPHPSGSTLSPLLDEGRPAWPGLSSVAAVISACASDAQELVALSLGSRHQRVEATRRRKAPAKWRRISKKEAVSERRLFHGREAPCRC